MAMDPIPVRLAEQQIARIDARCAKLGIGRAEYIRRAVDALLDADEALAVRAEVLDRLAALERRARIDR